MHQLLWPDCPRCKSNTNIVQMDEELFACTKCDEVVSEASNDLEEWLRAMAKKNKGRKGKGTYFGSKPSGAIVNKPELGRIARDDDAAFSAISFPDNKHKERS